MTPAISRPMRLMVLLLPTCGSTLVACGVGGQTPWVVHSPSSWQSSAPTDSTAPHVTSAGVTPQTLRIPNIDLIAHVEEVGETKTGDLVVPGQWQEVGWFASGYHPGDAGHAVIVGHLDTDTASHPQAAFWSLGRLHVGDDVFVDADVGQLHFRVVSTDLYRTEQLPLGQIFGPSAVPMLVLLTCSGSWHGSGRGYDHRLVVTTQLIS